MLWNHFVIRNLEGDTLRENFFVSAIATMLAIRFYLYVTGYPQLGGHGFHIAHMLWGGFCLMLAVIILLSFLNRSAIHIASILGGIGFGTFIDEIGKFITSDNNYFYQPSVAIIYLIFVLLYIGMKAIPKYPPVSRKEYLVNAMNITQDAVINDLDVDEEKLALRFLRRADQESPITKSLKKLLDDIEANPHEKRGFFFHFNKEVKKIYYSLAASRGILIFVILVLLLNMVSVMLLTWNILLVRPTLSVSEWGRLLSSLLSGAFVILGISSLRWSMLEALRDFKIAVLISILLTQVFLFYQTQFYALMGLGINIFLLLVINYSLERERSR